VLHSLSTKYSSIVVNQNRPMDEGMGMSGEFEGYVQEFHLPDDYRRGTDSGELRYPELSGIQLFVHVSEGYERQATFDYELEYQVFGLGWVSVTSGIATGAPMDGETWMTAYFPEPVPVDQEKASSRWRITFGSARPMDGEVKDIVVDYANGETNAFGTRVVADLVEGEPYHFTHDSKPAFLYLDPNDGLVYFSYEQGIMEFMITSPNPLAQPYNDHAYDEMGDPLMGENGDGAFCFRVLGLTADDGIDFLGNRYRSVVSTNDTNAISTAAGADPDSYWLSKPNPSKFAVENLYFDMRKTWVHPDTGDEVMADQAVVVDRILIDPTTPGAHFSIYYTDEGDPGENEEQWDNKLWVRIPQTYRMERRETHVFPEPIAAKYIKIEFSHLQARHYAPGNFQQSIRYKKHPKWVLDYFLARMQTDSNFLAQNVRVIYDALDLAYNYYLDDLGQEPQATIDVNAAVLSDVTSFLSDRDDVSDRIDSNTLDRLNLVLDPYRQHPALRGYSNTLLGDYARQTVDPNSDYAVEGVRSTSTTVPDVSSLNRDRVVVEQNYPVMFFFLKCRHKYREVEAKFSHDRAYFVGVRQIAFLRDNYMSAFDATTYIEPASDTQNIERNEF
jgi:hypothetical protein